MFQDLRIPTLAVVSVCVLCVVYCILYTVDCILYTVYCVLYRTLYNPILILNSRIILILSWTNAPHDSLFWLLILLFYLRPSPPYPTLPYPTPPHPTLPYHVTLDTIHHHLLFPTSITGWEYVILWVWFGHEVPSFRTGRKGQSTEVTDPPIFITIF